MQDPKKLTVYSRSHNFVLEIYQETSEFPRQEMYGITSQLRRAAYSIPSKIWEGARRGTSREFARYLEIALGSASELEYFLELSRDLGYISVQTWRKLTEEIQEIARMVQSLRKKVRGPRHS